MAINRLTQNHCCLCGRDRDKQYFDISPITGNFYPYCNTCLNTKYKQYITITGSEEAALWLTCALIETPVFKDKIKEAKELTTQKKIGLLRAYFEVLKNSGESFLGFFTSDIMLDDIVDIRQANDDEDNTNSEEIRHEREVVWGKFTDAEYDLLEQFFAIYTEDKPNMDAGQMLRYRDLCKAELRKRQIEEGEDSTNKDSKDVTDEILKLMKLLKIDDFQNNNQSEIEKFIERKAWIIENIKPAECEDLEKYKDFSGFGKTWDSIMRCVKNLVAGTREYPEVPKDER